MGSIFEDLRKVAEDAAENAKTRVAELDRKIAELQAQRARESGALQRLPDFPVKSGANYICPLCWMENGKMSPLLPDVSGGRVDIFMCRLCKFEQVVPA